MASGVLAPQSIDLKLEKRSKQYQLPRSDFRQRIQDASEGSGLVEEILKDETLSNLKSLWETKHRSDVNLVVDDTVIAAHKIVLIAASDYFRAMFSGDFSEADHQEVQLKDIDINGLKQITSAIYNGDINITDENIHILLDTADKVQIKELIDICEDFLTGEIRAKNCFELLQISEMYTRPTLNTKIETFIVSNFLEITQHSLYAHMHSDALITFISNDNMDVPEMEIFRAVLTWFKVNPSTDKQAVLCDVMKYVRFTFMKSSQIREVLKEPIIAENQNCVKMIETCLDFVYNYEEQVYSRPLLDASNPHKPRGKLSVAVILPEPDQDDRQFRQPALPSLFLFGASSEGTIDMSDINVFESEVRFAVFSMNMLQIENYLYFIGAKQLDEEGERAKMVLTRFNVQSGEWINLADPCFPALVVSASIIHKKDIYVFGGATYTKERGIAQHTFQDGSYKYSIEDNAWSTLARYPHPVAHPAACSSGDDVYLIGGGGPTYDTWERDQVFKYNTTEDKWTEKRPLNYGRSGHRVACVEGKIFAIGGRNPFRKDIPECEVYDPETNRWTLLENAPVPQPVASFNLLEHEGNIVILCGGDDKDVHHPTLQTLNTRTLKWNVYNWKEDQPHFLPTGSIHTLPLVRARMSCLTRAEYTPRKPVYEEPKEEVYWSDDEEFFNSDSGEDINDEEQEEIDDMAGEEAN